MTDMSNKRQLTLAWIMYAGDNNDTLVLNADESVAINGTPSWIPQICHMDWSLNGNNTNLGLLTTNELGRYWAGQFKLYKAPGDTFLAPIQQAVFHGASGRDRSGSMDAAVGGSAAGGSGAGAKPPGSLSYVNPFFRAVKMSQLLVPGPSKSWVFINEHPDSIDDGILYISPAFANGTGHYTELPASYLGGGCGISFADCHAEVHSGRRRGIYRPARPGVAAGRCHPRNLPLSVCCFLGEPCPRHILV